jgi:hypothetical protein
MYSFISKIYIKNLAEGRESGLYRASVKLKMGGCEKVSIDILFNLDLLG